MRFRSSKSLHSSKSHRPSSSRPTSSSSSSRLLTSSSSSTIRPPSPIDPLQVKIDWTKREIELEKAKIPKKEAEIEASSKRSEKIRKLIEKLKDIDKAESRIKTFKKDINSFEKKYKDPQKAPFEAKENYKKDNESLEKWRDLLKCEKQKEKDLKSQLGDKGLVAQLKSKGNYEKMLDDESTKSISMRDQVARSQYRVELLEEALGKQNEEARRNRFIRETSGSESGSGSRSGSHGIRRLA